ncbi:MAG TPA: DUF3667 domain-containing protein [Steroidobacteraceae bacterium]|nr:DUF3667 domain-containing protein [Steroidobacteraceae bacterium]
MSIEPTFACPSCGATGVGRYCSQCGEKRRDNHDFSIRHYLSEAIETFTHFDSKILRTAWRLIAHPGALSADYLEGRRIRYVNPLRLFLLFSVLYYFSNSIFPYNAFTTPLATQLHQNDYYHSFAASQVATAMHGMGMEYPAFERAYNEKTATLSKTLLFALIPVIALLLYAFLFRKKRYYSEHLVVATHFWSFALIIIGVFIPALLLVLVRLGAALGVPASVMTADSVPTLIIQAVLALYLFAMLLRVYRVSYWYSGVVAVVFAWSFFQIVWLFRFLLFVATLVSLG